MSTLQVDRIIPYQSSSVLVEGLSAPNLATTGSNTFVGDQNIQGTLTASIQEGFALVGGVGNVSKLVATSSFGSAIDTSSLATTGSNVFQGAQTITGSVSITGSLSITPVLLPNTPPAGLGQFIIPFLSGSNNIIARDQDNALYWQPAFNVLAVSASGGNTTVSATGMTATSATTGSAQITTTRIASNFGAGRNIAIAGDAASTALTGLTGITNPSIILQSGSVGATEYYAPIQFQASQSFTDGRVTITRPLIAQQGAQITGSVAGIRNTISSGSVIINSGSTATTIINAGNVVGSNFDGTQFQQMTIENQEGTVQLSIDGNGGYIGDYDPVLNDYSKAIKFQPFSNYGVGQVQILRALQVTGSVSISDVLQLAQKDPLPTGAVGQLAVSASNLYYHNGSSWTQIN